METDTGKRRGRGRPRDAEKDAIIRDVAWRLLAEKGYEALTFEAVADLASCSRSTLYRRFASKAELVEAILNDTSRSLEPPTDNLSARDALIAHAKAMHQYMSGPQGEAMLDLSVSLRRHPDLAAAMESYAGREQIFFVRALESLAPQGASPRTVEFAYLTLVGIIFFHTTLARFPLNDFEIALLVDQAITLLQA